MAITKVTTIEELISALNTQGTTELSLASNINLNGNKIAAPFDGFTIDAGSYAIVASTGSSITGFNIISSADAAIIVAGDNVSVTNNTISTTGTAIKSDIGVADLTVTGNRITSSGTANVIDIANASGTLTVDNNTISCSSIPMGVVVTDSTAAISVSGNAISYAIAKSGEAIAITAPKAAAITTEANSVSNLAAANTPKFTLASVGDDNLGGNENAIYLVCKEAERTANPDGTFSYTDANEVVHTFKAGCWFASVSEAMTTAGTANDYELYIGGTGVASGTQGNPSDVLLVNDTINSNLKKITIDTNAEVFVGKLNNTSVVDISRFHGTGMVAAAGMVEIVKSAIATDFTGKIGCDAAVTASCSFVSSITGVTSYSNLGNNGATVYCFTKNLTLGSGTTLTGDDKLIVNMDGTDFTRTGERQDNCTLAIENGNVTGTKGKTAMEVNITDIAGNNTSSAVGLGTTNGNMVGDLTINLKNARVTRASSFVGTDANNYTYDTNITATVDASEFFQTKSEGTAYKKSGLLSLTVWAAGTGSVTQTGNTTYTIKNLSYADGFYSSSYALYSAGNGAANVTGNITANFVDNNAAGFSFYGVNNAGSTADKAILTGNLSVSVSGSTMGSFYGAVNGTIDGNYTVAVTDSTANTYAVLSGSVASISGTSSITFNGTDTVSGSISGFNYITVSSGATVNATYNLNADYSSEWSNSGTLSIDMTDATAASYKLVDNKSTTAMTLADYGTVTLTGTGAENYNFVVSNNDLYAVSKNAVAKIGDTYYNTIQAAFDAVKSGETITILAGEYNEVAEFKNKASLSNVTIVGETDANGKNLVTWTGGILTRRYVDDASAKGSYSTRIDFTVSNIDFVCTYDKTEHTSDPSYCIQLKQCYGWTIENCSFVNPNVGEGGFTWNPICAPSDNNGDTGHVISNCNFVGGTLALRCTDSVGSYVYGYGVKVTGCTIKNTNFNFQSGGSYHCIFENNNVTLDYDVTGRIGQAKDSCWIVAKSGDAGSAPIIEVSGGSVTMKGQSTTAADDKGWSVIVRGRTAEPETKFTGVKFVLDSENSLASNVGTTAGDLQVNLTDCTFYKTVDKVETQITDPLQIGLAMKQCNGETKITVQNSGAETPTTLVTVDSQTTGNIITVGETETLQLCKGQEYTDQTKLVGTDIYLDGGTFSGNAEIAESDDLHVTSGSVSASATLWVKAVMTDAEKAQWKTDNNVAEGATVNTWVAAIGEQGYFTLAEAVAAVTAGQTIKLLCNVTDTETVTTKSDVAFSIDLAGYNYNNTATLTNNGTITLTDSTATADNHFNMAIEGGKVYVTGDQILQGAFKGNLFFGTQETAGTANTTYDVSQINGATTVRALNGTVTLTGVQTDPAAAYGTFYHVGYANVGFDNVNNTSATLTVAKGAYIYDHQIFVGDRDDNEGKGLSTHTLNVNGTIDYVNTGSVYVRLNGVVNVSSTGVVEHAGLLSDKGKVTIDAGTFNVVNGGIAVYQHGLLELKNGASFTITGDDNKNLNNFLYLGGSDGDFVGGTLKLSDTSSFTVTDVETVVNQTAALEVRAAGGKVEMSGTATLSVSCGFSNAGTVTMEETNLISYGGDWSNTGTFTVDMTGATADSYKLVDYTGSTAKTLADYGTVTLTGTGAANYFVTVIGNDLYAYKVSEAVASVTSGTKTTYYASLQAAFDAAVSGDTVKLLKDITLTSQVNILTALDDITFDGNDKTISCSLLTDATTGAGSSPLYFGNNDQGKWCTGVKIQDLTISGSARFGIFLCGGTTSTLTNVNISGNYYYAINLFGTAGATLTGCNIQNSNVKDYNEQGAAIWSNVSNISQLKLVNSDVSAIAINKYYSENPLAAKIYVDADSTLGKIVTYDDSAFSHTPFMCLDPAASYSIPIYTTTDGTISDPVTAVATANGLRYETVGYAETDVKAGGKIVLLASNLTDTTAFNNGNSYTFDLNGYNYETTGNVSDAITFANSTTKFTAANIGSSSITINGNTKVEAKGTYTNTALEMDLASLVITDIWSKGTSGSTINVTGTLSESFYKLVDQDAETGAPTAVADFGTVTLNGSSTLPEGYSFAVEYGDLVLKKSTTQEATGSVTETDITVTNNEQKETYVSQTYETTTKNVTVTADTEAKEMKVTGEISAKNTTINNSGETVHVTRDISSTAATTINTNGADATSKVEVGGEVKGATVAITNTNTNAEATTTVSAANGFTSTGDTTVTNSGAGDLTVSGGIVAGSKATVKTDAETESSTATGNLTVDEITAESVDIIHAGGNALNVTKSVTATGTDASETEAAAKIQNITKDADLTITANVYVKGGTLEIRNETAMKLDASGKLEVKDIKIYNNDWTSDSKLGNIDLTDQIEAAGDIKVTNSSTIADKGTGTAKKGIVNFGTTTHTAGGDLIVNNTKDNTINGSGAVETAAEETAAKFDVEGDATITNAGHINANVVAAGDVNITNTSVNTLIGDYTGANVTVENVGGAAHDVELTATTGDIDITNSTSAVEGSGEIDNLTANATNGVVQIHGNGTTTNAVINSDALYMGGATVEVTGGTILTDGTIYLQYEQFGSAAVDGAVLTIDADQTINTAINGIVGTTLYGTFNMDGTQTYTNDVAAKNINVLSGSVVTIDNTVANAVQYFDFGTLTITGTLNVNFNQLNSYTEAGTVTGAGTLNITTNGTWIVNDSVYRNFSTFAGTVTMADTTAIVMGIGDAPTDTALTAGQSYIGDNATMVVNGNSKVFLSGDAVSTGIKFTGNGNLYAGTYDETTGDLSVLGSADFTQTLTDNNSGFTGTMNVGEGAAVTLKDNFGGNVNLNYNAGTTAATTLTLDNSTMTLGGTLTGDTNDIVNANQSATLAATGALNAFTGEVKVTSGTLTLSKANDTSAKFTGAGSVTASDSQTLSAGKALDDFSGAMALGTNTLTLGGTNSTGATFTGTGKINADAKQTLTATGALNGFSGTVELEGNEIELDAANATGAKFTGTSVSTINADAKQTLTAEAALNGFSGTVALEGNEIELDNVNSSSVLFTGTGKINADAKQTLTATGALNGFSGTVELEGNEIELDAANATGAKFTGTSVSTINADAKQTLTAEAALNGFSGTIALEGNEIELDAANATGATITGTNLITAKANQTFSGDISGFSGTIDANGDNTVVTLSGTVADTLNLKGNAVVLDDAMSHASTESLNVAANTALTTLTANNNDVKLTGGAFTNVNSTTGNITLTGSSVTNVTSTSGNVDLTGWTVDKSLETLTTTNGTIYIDSANNITVANSLAGKLNFNIDETYTAGTADLTYTGTLAEDATITVVADADRFATAYKLITANSMSFSSTWTMSLKVGSYDAVNVKLNDGALIGGKLYLLTLNDNTTSKDLVLQSINESSNVYVNNKWTADPYAEVDDEGTRRYIGYDAAKSIDKAIEYISGTYATTVGTGLIELISTATAVTTNTNYAVTSSLGTEDNDVTNMTLRGRTGHKVTVTGDINAGLATILSLTNISATGSVYGAGTVNITGSTANRFSGSYIAAGGTLTITGGVYTTRYIAGGSLNAAAATDTIIVTLNGTSDRLAIAGSVYGGNIVTSGTVSQTATASVKVDTGTDKLVYIAGNIYAAGLNKGGTLTVSGNRTVTFTGLGSNLSFTGRVSGGAQGTATVSGTAGLVFSDFSGAFNGSISDFNTITISGNSALQLGRRQTLTGSTNLTFSVTSTTSSAGDTAMYTVRDLNAWEFGKSITVSAVGSGTKSGTYTLVGNYAAGFSGFTFTVAGQTATIGTTIDVGTTHYTLNYVNNKLTLAYVNDAETQIVTTPAEQAAEAKTYIVYATDINGANPTSTSTIEKISAAVDTTVVFNDATNASKLDENANGTLLYKDANSDIQWVGNGETATVAGTLTGNSIDISGKTLNVDTATITTVTANDATITLGGGTVTTSTLTGNVTVAEGKTLTLNVGSNLETATISKITATGNATIELNGLSGSTTTLSDVDVASGKTLTLDVGANASVNGNTISGDNGTVVIANNGTLNASVVNDVIIITNTSFNSLYGTYGDNTTTSVAIANTGKVENATFTGTTVTLNDAVNAGALGYYTNVTVAATTLNLDVNLANWAGTMVGGAIYNFKTSTAVNALNITIDSTTNFGTTPALCVLSNANYANTTFTVNGNAIALGDTFKIGDVTYELNEYGGSVYIFKGGKPTPTTDLAVNADWSTKSLFDEVTVSGSETKYYVGVTAFSTLAAAAAVASTTEETTITLDGTKGIVATSAFGGGQNVTITGTASLQYEYGEWMMVGRDAGTHGDVSKLAKVTFSGATITVDPSGTGDGSTSIHISGAEIDSASKGYGQLDVTNKSNVTTQWTIDKNVLNVNTGSTFTSVQYLEVAGRPASESPSGKDYEAQLNINAATVNAHGSSNGSGLTVGKDSEGKGIVNLTNGATLNANVINATAKSTINVTDSTITVGGTFANPGAFTNAGVITMNYASTITVDSYSGATGTITVDMTGATETSYVLIDASAASDYGTYQFASEEAANGYTLMVVDNDLMAVKPQDVTVTIPNDTAYTGSAYGLSSGVAKDVTLSVGTGCTFSGNGGIYGLGGSAVATGDVTVNMNSPATSMAGVTGNATAQGNVSIILDTQSMWGSGVTGNCNYVWGVFRGTGGQEGTAAITGNSTLTVADGTIANSSNGELLGAGCYNTSAQVVGGNATLIVGTTVSETGTIVLGKENGRQTIMGGGGTIGGTSSVTINNGTIWGKAIIGGTSWGGTAANSYVTINGGIVSTAKGKAIYGGSYTTNQTTGSTAVTITGGSIKSDIITGNHQAKSAASTTFTMTGGSIDGQADNSTATITVGCGTGTITGNATASITGGTINNAIIDGRKDYTDGTSSLTIGAGATLTDVTTKNFDTESADVNTTLDAITDIGTLEITGVSGLTGDVAGAKMLAGSVSGVEGYQVDDVDVTLDTATQIAGASTDDTSDDVWAKISGGATGLVIGWGRSESELAAAMDAATGLTLGDSITASVDALSDGAQAADFVKNTDKLA